MMKSVLCLPVRGVGRIVRQSGGLHRYGQVVLIVESAPAELSFSWEVTARQIPELFKDAVYRGVSRSFEPGAMFGSYVSDGLRVRIIDGSYHEQDSNEGSFEIAATLALKDALYMED
ncbi:hypothetical protein GJ699_18685 [Duganella sp. FT80W]|uniref:Translation elongation factor EFG/EF2 domain-containing protein n=1 Tax=Duganella guangzhouensis TaxID=2666084 RepID=A0A6I2L560_9BURK|nr:hypothetical protein [Duganella guangzhouensis]MRW92024.1 hypothetical protein [Duganella guangzhouensis]